MLLWILAGSNTHPSTYMQALVNTRCQVRAVAALTNDNVVEELVLDIIYGNEHGLELSGKWYVRVRGKEM